MRSLYWKKASEKTQNPLLASAAPLCSFKPPPVPDISMIEGNGPSPAYFNNYYQINFASFLPFCVNFFLYVHERYEIWKNDDK